MKANWIYIILSFLIGCSTFSICQGADRFYYGVYNGDPQTEFGCIKDSLRCNITVSNDVDSNNINYWVTHSLRAIVSNSSDGNSPFTWSDSSHYTLWEKERYPTSYYQLQYNGGTLVSDPNAHAGQAMKFSNITTPQTIQWGPSYYQEPTYESGRTIDYTVEFRLKLSRLFSPPDPPAEKSGNPPVPVCSLIVKNIITGSILKAKTINRSDFPPSDYQIFKIENYNVPDTNRIDFQIYMFGTPAVAKFYVDYVKTYNRPGERLMTGAFDQEIINYVSQGWVGSRLSNGDTVVYRWYLKDEPYSIDCFEPSRHIDSLLRRQSIERVGFQTFNQWGTDLEHEYFLRQNPKEYSIDIYPTRWYGPDSSGGRFQIGVDTLIMYLNHSKQAAINNGKDLWVTVQGHFYGDKVNSPIDCHYDAFHADTSIVPVSDTGWYCYHLNRPPTDKEVRLQTFLALCYGANSILTYMYDSWMSVNPSTGTLQLRLGLYNNMKGRPTDRWYEIKDFTGTRMEKLGPIINNLTWQGACSNQEVGSFILRSQPNYIDSIVGIRHPDSTYVQVGFFDHLDTSYFMLVNRKCLVGEDETLKVYFDMPNGPYLLRDMYTNQPSYTFYANCPSIISLKPGEGRLFRIETYPFSTHVKKVPQPYSIIQSAINDAQNNDTILVAPGTYEERINFNGKHITVASYYILMDEQQYKNYTRIDAHPGINPPDCASVVTFSSGEDSNSVLEGFMLKNGKGSISRFKSEDRYGGGIYCEGSSPTIRNNIIQGNQADAGRYSRGGGIYCTGCNPGPIISSNLIIGNNSIYGGGICCNTSSAKIVDNLIIENTASSFEKDTSLDDGGYGGGIECDNRSMTTIVNNTLDGNDAYIYGGGIDINGHSHVLLYNNIVSNTDRGDGIYVHTSTDTALISYNDFWNNFEDDIDGVVASGIGNTNWGNNRNGTPCDSFYNIFCDPDFVNYYHLDSSSACVNAGDNNAPDLPLFDYYGNPRIVDFVDIGASEYQGGGSGNKNAKIAGNTNSNNPPLPKVIPKEFALSQSYPNPFNPTAVIEFTIGSDHPSSHITLKIYNIAGQLVKTLLDEEKTPGTFTVTWDGKNNSSDEVASGIYFYELKSNNLRESKRMVLIK